MKKIHSMNQQYSKLKIVFLTIGLILSQSIFAGPFSCSQEVFFCSQSSGASVIAVDDPANVLFNYPFGLNAIGYNELDNYIYGIMKPVNHLVRFHSDGTYDDLGDLGGAINIAPVVGSFDDSGLFYVREGNEANSTVLVIDVASLTVTTDDSGGFRAKDWAYDPNLGAFYGVDADLLHMFTPGGGHSTSTLTGLLPGETNVYGSAFYAADGYVYAVNNVSRNLYRIDVASSEATYILTYNSDEQNDATSCPLADLPYPLVFAEDDMVCAAPTGPTTFNILDNDSAINTTIDNASFNVLDAPLYGTTTYNSATGELTYEFTGTPQNDVIHYEICGNGSPVVCDDAFIYITAGPVITFDPLGPYCQNSIPDALPTQSLEGYGGTWSPSSINTSTTGVFNYEFTPDPSIDCGSPLIIQVEITPEEISTFDDLGPYCEGDIPDLLMTTSLEFIVGTWSPATINTNLVGISNYTFTPDPLLHPCATSYNMMVEVLEITTPTFDPLGPYCLDDNPDNLLPESLEGIFGTWNPTQINTNILGTSVYEFTPDPINHPCANTTQVTIEVLEPLQITIISQTCSTDLSTYDVVFQISGGTENYSSVLVPGYTVLFDGVDEYTVTDIPAGDAINIEVEDNGNCSLNFTNTAENCDCPILDDPLGETDLGYCNGSDIPFLEVDNLIANQTVAWYDDNFTLLSNANPFQPSAAGIYIATIIDDLTGCESEPLTFTLTEFTPFVILSESYECTEDLLSYSVTLELAGGSGTYLNVMADPYTVTSLGGNTYLIEDIPSGENALITFIDENDCMGQVATSIHQCECPTIAPPTDQNLSYCQGAQLPELEVPNPGTAFLVNWYDEDQSLVSNENPYQPSTSGIYLVSYTNLVSNCESDLATVNVSEVPLPDVIEVDDIQYCFATDIPSINISLPLGTEAHWNQNGVELGQGASFTASQDGTYTIQIENINTGCLSDIDTFTIQQSPEIFVIQNGLDCSADLTFYDLTVEINGGQSPYQVSNLQSYPVTMINQSTFEIQNIPSGNNADLTVTDINGCQVQLTTTSQNCDCPAIEAPLEILPDTVCFGGSNGSLNTNAAPAGYTIQWYDTSIGGSSIGSGNTIINLSPGNYYAEYVEVASGCSSERTVGRVIENSSISASTNTTLCENHSDTYDLHIQVLGGQRPYEVEVAGHSVVKQNDNEFSIQGLVDRQEIAVLVTDRIGCEQSVLLSPEVLPSPIADAGPDQQISCIDGEVSLMAMPDGLSYTWTAPSGSQSNEQGITIQNEGSYVLQVFNPNGCFDTDTVEIEGSEQLSVSGVSSNDIDCINTCATLTATSSNNQVVFSWQGPESIEETSSNIVVCEPGNYSVQAVLGACTSDPLEISVEDLTTLPSITLADSTILDCESGLTLATVSTDISIPNIGWTNEQGVLLGDETSLTIDKEGYYYVAVSDPSSGCKNTDSIFVARSNITFSSAVVAPSCEGTGGSIIIDSVSGFYLNYSLNLNGLPALQSELTDLTAGIYEVSIMDEAGCIVTESFELLAPDGFTVDAGADVEINFGENHYLSPTISIDEASIVSTQWQVMQDLLCEDCTELEVRPGVTTTYTFVAIDSNGCTAQDDITIKLKTIGDIVIPNVISPSSENGNNRFSIPDNEYIERVLKYQIFDRWGNKVHSASNFDPREEQRYWNGTLDGRPVVPGVFVYLIELELIDGNIVQLVGDLTVVR